MQFTRLRSARTLTLFRRRTRSSQYFNDSTFGSGLWQLIGSDGFLTDLRLLLQLPRRLPLLRLLVDRDETVATPSLAK